MHEEQWIAHPSTQTIHDPAHVCELSQTQIILLIVSIADMQYIAC
jgi:hypothetical protein